MRPIVLVSSRAALTWVIYRNSAAEAAREDQLPSQIRLAKRPVCAERR